MKKIYWFKRKKDNYYFPIDSLIHAASQVERKDFNQKFEYIGYSDGSAYDEVFQGETMPVTEANWEKQTSHKAKLKRGDLTKKAFLKEIEMAKNNPDKTLPVHKAYGLSSTQFSGEQAVNSLKKRF